MKEIKIEHLAYLLKQAKINNQPQPIFFLGAGASRSGNIPLASEIVVQILHDYFDSPFIKDLSEEERTYPNMMNCLLPSQRDELLNKYIEDAKINVTHIYLAQLLNEGYVDYVLTVNFDNLMLRSLALFNIFPPTYDMAILKDLTTSTFIEKSVVYLHGQHQGIWLLNTSEEMEKVKNTVPRIIDTIKNKRPWIFIGYSGEDPIFDYIMSNSRFNNGLYWVTYNDHDPNESVIKSLSKPNINASVIKGYDADSFMLKLNSELGLKQPNVVDKPFTALWNMLNEIVDIDDKEHYKGVKERLEISKRQVEEAIQHFELGNIKSLKDFEENKIDLLKKEIINLSINKNFNEDEIYNIEKKAEGVFDENLISLLSDLYSNWGNYLGSMAMSKKGKEADQLYYQSFEKLQKAIEIKPDYYEAYYNWGTFLGELAKTKEGKEAEQLYYLSIEKLQKAIEIKPDKDEAYLNWGTILGFLAETKKGKEANQLYYQSFEKFQKAIEIKPDKYDAYLKWGNVLGNLANTKEGEEANQLYYQSFEKFQKAIEIKSDLYKAYYNWGTFLGELAKTKEGKEAGQLYNQSFEKFQKAIDIKPDSSEAYYNWGTILGDLAKTKTENESEQLYNQSFEKCQRAVELGGKCYNLACLYALNQNKKDALIYLDKSLSKGEVKANFVKNDIDWKIFLEDSDFLEIIEKY